MTASTPLTSSVDDASDHGPHKTRPRDDGSVLEFLLANNYTKPIIKAPEAVVPGPFEYHQQPQAGKRVPLAPALKRPRLEPLLNTRTLLHGHLDHPSMLADFFNILPADHDIAHTQANTASKARLITRLLEYNCSTFTRTSDLLEFDWMTKNFIRVIDNDETLSLFFQHPDVVQVTGNVSIYSPFALNQRMEQVTLCLSRLAIALTTVNQMKEHIRRALSMLELGDSILGEDDRTRATAATLSLITVMVHADVRARMFDLAEVIHLVHYNKITVPLIRYQFAHMDQIGVFKCSSPLCQNKLSLNHNATDALVPHRVINTMTFGDVHCIGCYIHLYTTRGNYGPFVDIMDKLAPITSDIIASVEGLVRVNGEQARLALKLFDRCIGMDQYIGTMEEEEVVHFMEVTNGHDDSFL